jgi:hypothetical protein
MKSWWQRPALALACLVLLLGCDKTPTQAEWDAFKARDERLRVYLKDYLFAEYAWQNDKLYPAICRLEQAANIPMTQRLCPEGPGTNGGAPPKPPVFPD